MQQKKERIYDDKIEVDNDKVHCFWNARAEKYDEKKPYVTVKLSDKNATYSEQWDRCEKETIFPFLELRSSSRVLDIGCGVGRLSEAVIPQCGYYLGTDYAEELLEIAKKRNPVSETVIFAPASFQDVKKVALKNSQEKFDCVLIAGVCQYINDEELKQCLRDLLDILSEHSTIYFSNPVAVEKRLTLNEFYSEELESNYSTIYRTIEEYTALFQELFDNGFTVKKQGYFDQFQKFKETQRHYFILKR